MFSVWERKPSGVYDPVGYYINEYRADNQYLGTTVKGAQNNDLYRLFVYAFKKVITVEFITKRNRK